MTDKKRKFKRLIIVFSAVVILIFGAVFLYCQNNHLVLTEYEIADSEIPQSFDGYRIVLLTDLHSKEYGEDNSCLAELINSADGDIIAVSGDTLNSRNPDDKGQVFIDLCARLNAPVYYVAGNHEQRRPDLYADGYYEAVLKQNGIIPIAGDKITVTSKDGKQIFIYGLDLDYKKVYRTSYKEMFKNLLGTVPTQKYFASDIKEVLGEKDNGFSVLLAHSPKQILAYSEWGADLVLAGHEHGGMVNLPYFGGMATSKSADGNKYDAGLFEKNGCNMIVSRGLGDTSIPIRIFNYPEVVVITLRHT